MSAGGRPQDAHLGDSRGRAAGFSLHRELPSFCLIWFFVCVCIYIYIYIYRYYVYDCIFRELPVVWPSPWPGSYLWRGEMRLRRRNAGVANLGVSQKKCGTYAWEQLEQHWFTHWPPQDRLISDPPGSPRRDSSRQEGHPTDV